MLNFIITRGILTYLNVQSGSLNIERVRAMARLKRHKVLALAVIFGNTQGDLLDNHWG